MLSQMILSMSTGAPHWIQTIDKQVAHWVEARGAWELLIMVLVYFAIGLSVLVKNNWRLIGIGLGMTLALVVWVVGQSLGGYYTGLATDLNTAPLIILLGLSVLNQPITVAITVKDSSDTGPHHITSVK